MRILPGRCVGEIVFFTVVLAIGQSRAAPPALGIAGPVGTNAIQVSKPTLIRSTDDIRNAVIWLDQRYRSAKDYADFESAIIEVTDLLSTVDAAPPNFLANESEDEALLKANNDRKGVEQLAHITPLLNYRDKHWNASTGTPAQPDFLNSQLALPADRTNSLRYAAAEMFAEYGMRPYLTPRCRAMLLESIGSRLSLSDFAKFRDLIVFRLFRLVWRERAAYGYLTVPGQGPDDKSVLEQVRQDTQNDPLPTTAFTSISLGLYQAALAQDHKILSGGGLPEATHDQHADAPTVLPSDDVYGRLRDLLKLAPLDDYKAKTTILKCAFGSDDPMNEGFFRLIFRKTPSPDNNRNVGDVAAGILDRCQSSWETKTIYSVLQAQLNDVSLHIIQIDARIAKLEDRMTKLEARMDALETRVSELEIQVARLWQAIQQVAQFSTKYQALCVDHNQFPVSDDPTVCDLTTTQRERLLRRLAPILLTDKGPANETPETIVSVDWLSKTCPVVGRIDSDESFLSNEGYPTRSGPEHERRKSLDTAVGQNLGVYGLVQPLANVEGLYSVQYYVLFAFNAAKVGEIDVGPFGDYVFDHAGDWLCIDLTILLIDKDVDHPIIALAYYHNHGPVIQIEPTALETEDLHPRAYLEFGSNEPEPHAGGVGDRHTNMPGIKRNRRIKDLGFPGCGRLNELIERISVRSHEGNGKRYDTSPAVQDVNGPDAQAQFIQHFHGRWGSTHDSSGEWISPQSPFWNLTMRRRNFEGF